MITFPHETNEYHSLALTAIEEAKLIEPPRSSLICQATGIPGNSMKWLYSVIADRHEVLSEIQRRYHNHDPYIAENLFKLITKR